MINSTSLDIWCIYDGCSSATSYAGYASAAASAAASAGFPASAATGSAAGSGGAFASAALLSIYYIQINYL